MSIVCDTGFINIVDPFLNPDSTVWTGSITYTLQYATTVAGATLVEARQVINVSDGIDICLAPGLYTVVYNQSGQRLPVTSQWTVPPTGGPYTIADLEGVGPVTGSLTVTGPFIAMSTVTMTSLINAAARPYVATDSVGLLSTGNLALIAISGSASDLASGTVAAARGGAGTLSGLLKANGAGVVSAAVAGTDYSVATNGTNAQFLTSNGAGGFGTAVSSTGSGSVVLATSPTLTTPDLGTPSVLVLTNATGLPAAAMPGLTGDVTSFAGSVATTVVKINGTALSGLATGLLKNTTATGVPSIAVAGTDYAVATNGTIGQALTSNGTGGFSTALTLATVATSGSASDLTAGTLAAARMPAITGDVTTTVGTVAATVVKINGTTLSGLATGLLKNTTATGVPSIAVAGTDLIGGVGNLTTVGSVPYVSASGILNQDAGQFFWDATNNRLGIGTATPSQSLEVSGGAIIASGYGNRAAATGAALEIGWTGTTTILQSYNRTTSASVPAQYSALNHSFDTSGSVRMTILGGGNVGIGTATPAQTLHVKSASNEILSDATTGDATLSTGLAGVRKWSMYNQSAGNNLLFYDWTNSVSRVTVQPGTATAMTILASGNVGIGTTAPGVILDILAAAGEIRMRNDATNTLALGNWDGSAHSIKSINLGIALTPLSLQASRFEFNTGSVGIGTTAPAAKLQVGTAVGSPATNGNAVIINAANTTLSSRGGNLQVITTNSSAVDLGGSIGLGGQYNTLANSVEFASIAGRKENSTAANFAGYLQFVTTADGVAPTEKMRITSAGSVLIGGTTDGAYKFDVQKSGASGTARFYDQTATTGATRVLISLGAADTTSTQVFEIGGLMKFSGLNSTGAGTALLSTNSPAVTNTAPYTWFKVLTSDGSTGYIPVWK